MRRKDAIGVTELEIDYPCEWPYKVIGSNSLALEEALR